RVIHNIAVLSNLNRDLELDRALRQPLIQLVEQIVRSLCRSRRTIQLLLPRLWNNRVPPIPAHAILIGELHRSKPKVLLLRKARRKRCNPAQTPVPWDDCPQTPVPSLDRSAPRPAKTP